MRKRRMNSSALQCHRLLLVAATIVLPAEANLAILDVEDAIVGYGDAVCIAADIVQNLLRSGEGALGIDHPFGLADAEPGTAGRRRRSRRGAKAEKNSSSPAANAFSRASIRSAGTDGREPAPAGRSRPAGDPSAAIRRQPAAGHDTMQMWVVQESLTPGVEDGEEADLRTQMLGVGGDRRQSLGDRAEENAVDGLLVLKGYFGDLFRHGENDMKVLRVENLGPPIIQPLGAGQ